MLSKPIIFSFLLINKIQICFFECIWWSLLLAQEKPEKMVEGTVVFQPYGSDGRIGCISFCYGFSMNMSWNFSTSIGQLNGDWHWWLTLYIELKTIFSLFASSGHNSTQWGQVFLLSETAVALIIKNSSRFNLLPIWTRCQSVFFNIGTILA